MKYVLSVFELATLITILVQTKISEKYTSEKFKIMYVVPLFITVAMILMAGFDIHFIGVYLTSTLILAALFPEKNEVKRGMISACMVIVTVTIFINAAVFKKHTDYEKDFDDAFEIMREHYVLSDEKEIDWDALYAKYQPLFHEIEVTQDRVANFKTWQMFTKGFYDGHTNFVVETTKKDVRNIMESYGNDYGLSIAKLSDGKYVAVNVEGYDNSYTINDTSIDDLGLGMLREKYTVSDADEVRETLKNAGIANGTVITEWNGKPVEEYFDEINYYLTTFTYPVKENEDFYLPMYVAGIGENLKYGDSFAPDKKTKEIETVGKDGAFATITYLDENGDEKEIKAPCLGAYAPRLYNTIKKIDAGKNITNLSWDSVNEDTVLLRISSMQYDTQSYAQPDEYATMIEQLEKEVIALKESGIKNIIFDLRSNTGGDPFFVQSVAGLFAPEGENVNVYTAKINEKTAKFDRGEDGKYQMADKLTYEGRDLWHDGNIILLVNAECISAGDDMTYVMGEYPNVKVIGITRTNSSCQAVSGVYLATGMLTFSAVPTLTKEGVTAIDTFSDRIGRTPFDEYIPFDSNAVSMIFDKGEDYPLQYAAEAFDDLF
ncbi:MAG: hypothetical protein K5776_04300 [Lachnospiraceae bacterium]|nr:hypothetical protein [Lachnospiraceae bacterium]